MILFVKIIHLFVIFLIDKNVTPGSLEIPLSCVVVQLIPVMVIMHIE